LWFSLLYLKQPVVASSEMFRAAVVARHIYAILILNLLNMGPRWHEPFFYSKDVAAIEGGVGLPTYIAGPPSQNEN
jgi:hypothetical protein